MAFGFHRQAGSGRGYVNDANPDFAIGQRLSRRQYDKYIERIGKRTHLPGAEAIRETERLLEQLRANLAQRAADLDAQAAGLDLREEQLALREQELAFEQQLFRKGRQSAGQRRYNALLNAYVGEQRRRGVKINKRQAAASAEFKQIVKDVKGRPNKKNNPNIRDQNRFNRMKALDKIGGSNAFREYYKNLDITVADDEGGIAYGPRSATYKQIASGGIGSRVATRARNRATGYGARYSRARAR